MNHTLQVSQSAAHTLDELMDVRQSVPSSPFTISHKVGWSVLQKDTSRSRHSNHQPCNHEATPWAAVVPNLTAMKGFLQQHTRVQCRYQKNLQVFSLKALQNVSWFHYEFIIKYGHESRFYIRTALSLDPPLDLLDLLDLQFTVILYSEGVTVMAPGGPWLWGMSLQRGLDSPTHTDP